MNIGKYIKKYRTELNISQKDLAERVGLHLQKLRLIEDNEEDINISLLESISNELNIPISYFFLGNNENSKVTPKLDSIEKKLVKLALLMSKSKAVPKHRVPNL
jgi:transcriptional regulator with XRE-family HTH domain